MVDNPPLHIICGRCGFSTALTYKIVQDGVCDRDGVERPGVYITCSNCGTLTGLDEVLEEIRG